MILYGASGHAKVIIDILHKNNIKVSKIIDDEPKNKDIFNIPVEKGTLTENNENKVIISIGNNEIRKKISEKHQFDYQTIIHPSAVISEFSKIGNGTVIMANAVVNSDSEIGKHCIINTSAIVEHDCKISDFVHISPNASLAGNVEVGEGTHVGIGACVIQGVKIGKWATIGAGAVIIRDVPDFATVVGNPGKIIKIKEIK
ncbi:acetyltransferase [Capnocytophaga cynodegmi]|uniref:acetyltransferase n=1 Tax=Capnocytophaga cynodegmi TaxID=28189 RepID=UPI001AC5E615|nr:acetyltransferase [Capnocytophaga cynodegmi]GIM51482.1 acetyltransferase [Capnocytophaga cynodegmi]